MKKIFLGICILLIISCNREVEPQEIKDENKKNNTVLNITNTMNGVYFKVKKPNTKYWAARTFSITPSNNAGVISKSEILKGKNFFIGRIDNKSVPIPDLEYKSQYIQMPETLIESIRKVDDFPKDMIRDLNDPAQKIWMRKYYLDAIEKKDRGVVYERQKRFWEFYMTEIAAGDEYKSENWYEEFIFYEGVEFYWTGLIIEGFSVFIDQIKLNKDGFVVTLLGDESYGDYYAWMQYDETPWPDDGDKKFFNLIFEFDGDYLDVYLGDKNTKFAEYVHVDPVFEDLIYDILREGSESPHEPYDKSKVKSWPRRADGSMDYPMPSEIAYGTASHRTQDRLRLRDTPDTKSLIVTVLETESCVQVLETGKTSTIDGMTAPWVKVVSEDGFIGWCFSGYLTEI